MGRYCHSPHQATSACMVCRRKKKRCHRDGMCCPGNRCNNGTAASPGLSSRKSTFLTSSVAMSAPSNSTFSWVVALLFLSQENLVYFDPLCLIFFNSISMFRAQVLPVFSYILWWRNTKMLPKITALNSVCFDSLEGCTEVIL